MNRKIIGILIILSGVFILVGMIYFGVRYFGVGFNYAKTDVSNTQNTSHKIPVSTRKTSYPNQEQNIILDETDDANNQKAVIDVTKISMNDIKQNNEEEKTDIEKNNLLRLASSFSERFGSYSNHSNFSNIRELLIFMSSNMRARNEAFIRDHNSGNTDIYYGIVTKAISADFINYDDNFGEANIRVKTLRKEMTGTTNNASTFYQDIELELIKERGSWKINKATWK